LRRKSHSDTGTPKIEFLPAYILKEDNEERLGREKDWKQTEGSSKMHEVEGNGEAAVIDNEDQETKSG
jgi:hypothetical protein